ncbi:VOC family protein [Fodinibius halophilus]|uniref:VOC family protein n=1 Tax=Fodinibius halophilus TaxID=1736908 RepID=A0A6M1T9C9_9BACT|nr:VOC family protein [Fodinibius halophilus]NGP87644.1 VOC family protein [Fodinibius halophilus]
MISRLSHATIYVLDQDEAIDFYVDTLGFELKEDADMGEGNRWVTICSPDQPEPEIILMEAEVGMSLDKKQAGALQSLIRDGVFGFGVFDCTDIYATYEELKSKGVYFKKSPQEEFYGTEAIFEDPFGNWFSLVERGK